MTADTLLDALAKRHADAVFVPECKDGPTQTRAHRRLDAWVLLKRWSPITTIGYEIKVDRADWRRDDKIHDYMPLCHLLYICAPKGIVPVEEIPETIGLIEPIGENGRLQIRRKAARREITLPSELMVYVLMCRAQITREQTDGFDRRAWRVKELREWVEGKAKREELSYAVSRKIREVFDNQKRKQTDLDYRLSRLEQVRDRIRELGFDPDQPSDTWKVQQRLNELAIVINPSLVESMRTTSQRLIEGADHLERISRAKS